MSGSLVISLDFELMWGVRDHRAIDEYGDAVMGGREAIPQILGLFSRYRIKATWATVGFVFARTRDEILDYAPDLRPDYERPVTSPYAFVERGLGRDEKEDPLHFGHSLVERISQTEGQEVGTHSFSHFCCLEPGHSPDAFSADLSSAIAIGRAKGIDTKSLVFARNQLAPEYVEVAKRTGIATFRGNPRSKIYHAVPQSELTRARRAMRFLDSFVDLTGKEAHPFPAGEETLVNVPASRFLRPWMTRLSALNRMHRARVEAEMEHAARSGGIYHLWWHPHNFGRNSDQNLAQLAAILTTYERLRDRYGMRSMAMHDFNMQARES